MPSHFRLAHIQIIIIFFFKNCSDYPSPVVANTTSTSHEDNKVEIKLNDFEIIYQHLDKSRDPSTTPSQQPTVVSQFEKFLNKKIATSEPRECGSAIDTDIFESASHSSKSSINSEEGYYSNHDSSVSTLTNELAGVMADEVDFGAHKTIQLKSPQKAMAKCTYRGFYCYNY